MKLAAVRNVEFEDLGSFREAFERRGISVFDFRAYEGEFPSPEEFDVLVVLGGPMGVYEEENYPFLKEEKELISSFISSGKKVLGICLGAQLIAEVLGGKVYRGEWGKEIGWSSIYPQYDLEFLYRDEIEAFHWHGDTFDLPKGAVRLASSVKYKNQAFRFGKVLALQFHLEVTREGIEKWIDAYREELRKEGIQEEELLSPSDRWKKLKLYGDVFVEYFLKL
ncbi:MAG: GMP synthase [Desulfurobacteriaceae bacterium]